jgi:hypothetical protein
VLEDGALGKSGETIVIDLMSKRTVFVLQCVLPRLEFVEQGVEILTELAKLGDCRRLQALTESSVDAYGVRHAGKVGHRAGDAADEPPGEVDGGDRGRGQTQHHADESG